MGKCAAMYHRKYEEAKKSGLPYRFLNHPHLWMLIAYFADHDLNPLNDEYKAHLDELKKEDEEMYDIVSNVIKDFFSNPEKYLCIADTTPKDAPQNLRIFDICERK